MKVSVIIPVFNRQAFIAAALESVVRQRHDCDLDVLVIDDGSTDSSPQIVRAFITRFPQIRMITIDHQGVAKARNAGLRNLCDSSEYVTFLDSDDVMLPGRLHDDLAEFAAEPTLQVTYAKSAWVEDIDHEILRPTEASACVEFRGVYLGAAIFDRKFMEKVGLFDETMVQAEDLDFLLRTFEQKPVYKLTDTVANYYRRHEGNLTKRHQEARKAMLRALQKSVFRRRGLSDVRFPPGIFDLQPLNDVILE